MPDTRVQTQGHLDPGSNTPFLLEGLYQFLVIRIPTRFSFNIEGFLNQGLQCYVWVGEVNLVPEVCRPRTSSTAEDLMR